MKITVEIEELDGRVTTSRVVADYVRAMLKVRSLRRAVGEALLEAEHCKKKLRSSQLAEAAQILDGADAAPPRPLLRRLSGRRPSRQDRPNPAR